MQTIESIFKLAVDLAKKADLRGSKAIAAKLRKIKESYEKLDNNTKNNFDRETFINPYSDSRILVAPNRKKIVKKILTGIDIDTAELLIAEKLKVDLVLSHHPEGIALAGLDEVMDMQVQLLAKEGVPINIAQNLMHLRISEVSRSLGSRNHYQVVDAAKLLNISLMCTHTITDNLVTYYLYNMIQRNKNKLETVGDIMNLIENIPEYRIAAQRKFGPKIFVGRENSYAGKIVITEMTGGTNGSKDIYEHLRQAGVGTIIGMHMHEEWKKEAEKNHINVVIAGHISSDSLGMNLFLDELEKRGIEIITCGGLIRYSRNK